MIHFINKNLSIVSILIFCFFISSKLNAISTEHENTRKNFNNSVHLLASLMSFQRILLDSISYGLSGNPESKENQEIRKKANNVISDLKIKFESVLGENNTLDKLLWNQNIDQNRCFEEFYALSLNYLSNLSKKKLDRLVNLSFCTGKRLNHKPHYLTKL